MPYIGEIVRAKDIGLNGSDGYRRYIWHACEKCGLERWIYIRKGKPSSHTCKKCEGRSGILSSQWKGGRRKARGYISVKVYQGDFFYPMATKEGYVAEHRLIMAQHLGRCLILSERVHHKNGIRDDNRLENLELIGSQGEHMNNHLKGYQDGFQKGYYEGRDKRIKELLLRIEELEETRL